MSITHSYYDSSPFNDKKSYWNRVDERFIDSSIAIPLFITGGFYTELAIYPIFSASEFSIGLSFFDTDGNLLHKVEEAARIEGENQQYQLLNFGEVISNNQWNEEEIKSVRIECYWQNKELIPTRVKFGLNVGYKDLLPSNICFAPILGNPNILNKKSTFKWSPIVNMHRSVIVLTNSSSLKLYEREALITLNFYRENDDSNLERKITIPAFGSHTIDLGEDMELKAFLEGKSGWLTAFSENPHINGWYFDFHENGSVGADHIF